MRELTDHIVSGDQAVQLRIQVVDEPGQGGACHDYLITGMNSVNPSVPEADPTKFARIVFQNGPIKAAGVNGITGEALMAIQIDHLRSSQSGPYACRENAIALTKLEEALLWLQKRTMERIRRNVEGTHKA